MSGLLTAADTTWITAVVSSSLDQSLALYRPIASNDYGAGTYGVGAYGSTGLDGYGHDTYSYPSTPTHTIACNVTKPSATVLQAYANIIASRRSLVLRVLAGTDILENDQITYDSLSWVVQAKMNANSYSVTMSYIITAVV